MPQDEMPVDVPVDVPIDVPIDVTVVGGGNMGAALLGGMIESGTFAPGQLAVVELLDARRAELKVMFPGVVVSDTIPSCRGAVLAVKPIDAPAAARAAVASGATRLLSIAAGVRLATLDEAAGPGVVVIRSMPNTPALVGKGAAAIAAGAGATDADIDWATSILGAVGTVDVLPETLLDAFTGVAGSGPAYLFLIAESLIDAAVDEGIERGDGRACRATTDGRLGDVARPRTRSGAAPPAGHLARRHHRCRRRSARSAVGVRELIAATVRAATERSRELG